MNRLEMDISSMSAPLDRHFRRSSLPAETPFRCALGHALRRYFPEDTGHRLLCPVCDADYIEEIGYGHGV